MYFSSHFLVWHPLLGVDGNRTFFLLSNFLLLLSAPGSGFCSVKGYHRTTTPPHHRTAVPPYRRTTAPPYHRTTVPSHHRTTVPPYHRHTVVPSYRRTLAPSHRPPSTVPAVFPRPPSQPPRARSENVGTLPSQPFLCGAWMWQDSFCRSGVVLAIAVLQLLQQLWSWKRSKYSVYVLL